MGGGGGLAGLPTPYKSKRHPSTRTTPPGLANTAQDRRESERAGQCTHTQQQQQRATPSEQSSTRTTPPGLRMDAGYHARTTVLKYTMQHLKNLLAGKLLPAVALCRV